MSVEGISFKVNDDLKFWILEQKKERPYNEKELSERKDHELKELAADLNLEVPEKAKKTTIIKLILSKHEANAWVFKDEKSAITKLKELMLEEDMDASDLTSIEKIGQKYNLQEVQIASEKYNMRSVSWLKVFLLSSHESPSPVKSG